MSMRSAQIFFVLLSMLACTQAPAPCLRAADCETGACINGACTVPPPVDVDQGEMTDGQVDPDGGRGDQGGFGGGIEPVDLGPIPDAQPGCEGLNLAVNLPENLGPLRRDEPVQLTVTRSDGATLSYESTAGGAFVEDPSGARWIARDEVRWPWRTGTVTLTVHADLEDCRATRRVQVTLLGDLLLGDVLSGQIRAVGSNGTPFGQWRLVDRDGINTMCSAPDGGFIIAIRGPSIAGLHSEPELIRLNADGQEIGRFDTVDLQGTRLFNRPVKQMYVVDNELVAVNEFDDFIRWFDLDGTYLRSVPTGNTGPAALAPWGATELATALFRQHQVRRVVDGGLMDVGQVDREIYGLYPLRDGSVAVVQNADENKVDRLEPDGRIVASPGTPVGYSMENLIPFDDGYLALSNRGSWVIEFDADLTPLAGDDFKFAPFNGGNPRSMIWLNTP